MKVGPLLRLFKLVPRLKKWAWLAGVLVLLEGISAPILGWLLRHMVDAIFSLNEASYPKIIVATTALVLGMSALAWMRTKTMARISEEGAGELRRLAAQSLLDMPMAKLDAVYTGDLLSRFTNDAAVIRHYLYFELYWLFGSPMGALLGLVYVFFLDWQLSLATLLLIPFLIFLSSWLSQPIQKISGQLQERLAAVNNQAQDALGGAEIVKAFNLQEEMEQRNEQALGATVASGLSLAKRNAVLRMCSVISGILPIFIPLALGGWFVVSGRLSPGTVIAFIQMLNQVSWPISQLPVAMGGHQKAIAAFERVYELLDEPKERQGGEVFHNGQDVILQMENVEFGYNSEPILNGLNLELMRGETVALVGPSGSGKTTVLKVLVGFYPPWAGQVCLYGQPLTKWNLAAARRQMAMVSQDTFLFPGTIAENIALGNTTASREQIEAAAIQANAAEFISQLPNGYDYVLEERGANLSGGQRQRLSLARAILLDAPLLLLDEATSALDTESERLVQDALDNMAASRTTLVVAHRLSTIRSADRILVLDGGKIVESGRHQELLDRGGLYRQLYLRQLGGESEAGGAA